MYRSRPAADRAAYYREMSDATFVMAERTYVLPMVEGYVKIATEWLRMAVLAEQELALANPTCGPGLAANKAAS